MICAEEYGQGAEPTPAHASASALDAAAATSAQASAAPASDTRTSCERASTQARRVGAKARRRRSWRELIARSQHVCSVGVALVAPRSQAGFRGELRAA